MSDVELEEKFDELGGIMPVTGESFSPPGERELAEIERLIGEPLPEPYRSFLAKYGATMFSDNVFYPPIEEPPDFLLCDGQCLLNVFYGSEREPIIFCQILKCIRDYAGRVPTGLIPIASDANGEFGNQICLGVSGKDKGKLFLWIHDRSRATLGVGDPTLFLVAHSFEEFCLSLNIMD